MMKAIARRAAQTASSTLWAGTAHFTDSGGGATDVIVIKYVPSSAAAVAGQRLFPASILYSGVADGVKCCIISSRLHNFTPSYLSNLKTMLQAPFRPHAMLKLSCPAAEVENA